MQSNPWKSREGRKADLGEAKLVAAMTPGKEKQPAPPLGVAVHDCVTVGHDQVVPIPVRAAGDISVVALVVKCQVKCHAGYPG